MRPLPELVPQMLDRKENVPVEEWHLDFHRHLDVLEKAVAVKTRTGGADLD